ncbi:LysR family transcriptional regulator [Modicisalibacter coralii]|uniref:LysR family transcriptional regulator n=1 Tax=Modicisalibacter coralii TaxID=2304602 RepID=UPI00100B761B|nr:LysR family transcriptional regulator [Halomonas coralii]
MHDAGKGISTHGKPASRDVDWNDARAFLAVVRSGTLSGAAHSLGVGVATLSRRIERLEAALNRALFTRQQSGYRLTEDGERLVDKAEALEAAAHAFTADGGDHEAIAGTVRLATAENLATGLILPALADFRERHPALTVELVTDIATANLHRRDADLAIRMVRPERGHVSLRRLATLGYGLYASPAYAAGRRGVPENGYDADRFIAWDDAYAHLPAARWMERTLQGRRPALTTTSLRTQVEAAAQGLGLAVLPHFTAREAGLVCIDPAIEVEQPIYLVIQTDLTRSPRVRALADFLSERVIQHAALLGGPVSPPPTSGP